MPILVTNIIPWFQESAPVIMFFLKPNSQRIKPWCVMEFELSCWIQPLGTPWYTFLIQMQNSCWIQLPVLIRIFVAELGNFDWKCLISDKMLKFFVNRYVGRVIDPLSLLWLLAEFSCDVQNQQLCHWTYWIKCFVN